MARAQTTQARIIWAILTIVAVAFCIVMAVDLIDKYYRFEYDVQLEISFKPQLDFPVVTICNLNPIKKSEMLKRPAFKPLFAKDFPDDPIAPLPTTAGSTMSGSGTGGTGTATKEKAGTGTATGSGTSTPTGTPKPRVRRGIAGVNDDIERPTPPANLTFDDLDASSENYNLFSEINAELFNKLSNQKMYDIGTKASEFIAKCTFKQKPCAARYE